MNSYMHSIALILVIAAVTAAIRFAPFIIFKNKTPGVILYLGKVLPTAIIGMLVVYCLKGVKVTEGSHGLPELIAVVLTVTLHKLKHNTLLSIIGGTLCYMLLIQFVF